MKYQLVLLAALVATACAFGPKSHQYQFNRMDWANDVNGGLPALMPYNAGHNTFSNYDMVNYMYSTNNDDHGFKADFRADAQHGFTLELRFKVTMDPPAASNPTSWRKIVDTKSCDMNDSNYGLYVGPMDESNPSGDLALIYHTPNNMKTMASIPFPRDQHVQVWFDYDRSENKVTGFQEGTKIFEVADADDCTFKNFNNVMVSLFHDDAVSCNENGAGQLDYVEFYGWCEPGTWFDECKNTCEMCACGCKTCDGPTNWHCDCCEEGYYLYDSPMSEEEKKNPANWFVYPDGHVTYPDESCRKCSNTMPHCIGCTWFNECYHCEYGWVLNEDKTGCMPWTQEWQDAQDAMNN